MYTHIVKRDSGYIAGWFGGGNAEQEAAECAAECNHNVPGDPAHIEALDLSAWDALLAEG